MRLTDALCNLASGEVGNQCRHVRVIGHAHWHTRRLLSTLMLENRLLAADRNLRMA